MVGYAARHEFDVLVCKNMKRIEKKAAAGWKKKKKKNKKKKKKGRYSDQ